jgi:hypothetical protein
MKMKSEETEQLSFDFIESQDIPAAHFYAFKVCNAMSNNHRKQQFYRLKNSILAKYAHPNDYDIQHVEKKCHTCYGSGMYWKDDICRNCNGTGIWANKKVVLQRYILNGQVFHQPKGELTYNGDIKIFDGYDTSDWYDDAPRFRYEKFTGVIKDSISGIIEHKPYKLNSEWAFFYLLWFYDREQFFTRMNNDLKAYQTNTQHKLRQLLSKFSPLKAYAEFYKVEKSELEPIDDLPF